MGNPGGIQAGFSLIKILFWAKQLWRDGAADAAAGYKEWKSFRGICGKKARGYFGKRNYGRCDEMPNVMENETLGHDGREYYFHVTLAYDSINKIIRYLNL